MNLKYIFLNHFWKLGLNNKKWINITMIINIDK